MKNDLLYHYTSEQGLISILNSIEDVESFQTTHEDASSDQPRSTDRTSSVCLRASNLRFMNDPGELNFALSSMAASLRHKYEHIDGFERGIEVAKQSIGRTVNAARFSSEQTGLAARDCALIAYLELCLDAESEYWRQNFSMFYSVSFSSDGDLLGMWRNYGLNGGYALGFDRGQLIDHGDGIVDNFGMQGELLEIEYGTASLHGTLSELRSSMLPTIGANGPSILLPELPPRLLAKHKHGAYEEEHETRLLVSAHSCMNQTPKIRTSPNGLVPYIDYWIPVRALRKIVVGPSPAQARDPSVLEMALQTPRGEKAHIEVVRSQVPFAY